MLNAPQSYRGMVTSPHHLASQTGLAVLRDGGNAIEAAVAVAATIAVIYPHMTGIGGDAFWLIHEPGQTPFALEACGRAGRKAEPDFFRARGHQTMPQVGPFSANTVAGTIGGWQAALAVSEQWGGKQSLGRLLEEAIYYAEEGFALTSGHVAALHKRKPLLADQPGFAAGYLKAGGAIPEVGARQKQPALAGTLRRLRDAGLDDYYRGEIAKRICGDLAQLDSPVELDDYKSYQARRVSPLSTQLSCGTIYNLPPPTQGLTSLMILSLFDRMGVNDAEGFEYLHGMVEATKQAHLVRDRELADPAQMARKAESYLSESALQKNLSAIDREKALPWPVDAQSGDTIWLGVIDNQGRAVSMIQSTYKAFGSGVVLPETGIIQQNRGSSFVLEEDSPRCIAPGRLPFHTLNPAMAVLNDGRVMTYGCMGGDGQPQTQAAIFSRYALFGQGLQAAVTAPRWFVGRSEKADFAELRLEGRFSTEVLEQMRNAGHQLDILEAFSSEMGHAGAIVLHPDGRMEGATDPRSDGAVAGY
ncbi:gamma-glutamyltransferase family protein [Kiloniella laminariae]|uniref:Gamma-glutamyltransferase family protein n=1 Tax=Kiloniella laminariae TaxID=454162 RepID=A0ABT4LKH6_9PROT|nr:gamma-glutamyltransferase family protein [Kiloniella laminariae]MCZ4281613.1 gamma-glutamyltransferase family protein [Kiloniella laminariae]